MKYTALDPSQRQIRILHLHPGQPEDDVACHLSIIFLDDHDAEYEALSYVWGESTKGRVVHIGGIYMPVTDNLWEALTGLRYLDRERILWVDALCINRSDNEERSDQVSHMNSIYTQASSTEIWLGESYEGIEVALIFLTEFATGLTAEGKSASYGHLEGAMPEDYDPGETDKSSLNEHAREIIQLVSAMEIFAENSWFERVWTVQGFFLPRKSTFHCGAQVLDGAIFIQSMYHLSKHKNKVCCVVHLPLGLQLYLYNLFLSTHAIRLLKIFRTNFLDCVAGFRSRKATNPRDKIYGLLGLGVEDVIDFVRPDYTLPVEKVFENFVVALLKHTKNLDILSHLRAEQRQNLILPSFVPDWTLDFSNLKDLDLESWCSRCSILDIYDAAFGTQADFEARPGSLSIRGVIVDTVKTTAIRTVDSVQQNGGLASAWNEFLDELIEIAAIPPRDQDPGLVRRKEYWLSMVAASQPGLQDHPAQIDDVNANQKQSDSWDRLSGLEPNLYEGYEKVLRTINVKDGLDHLMPDEIYLFDLAFGHAQNGRKFMATEVGRIGLIPKHAKKGDVIAVLTGGRVPIILRPKEGFYTVVGDAYIHGIMDGEAMQDVRELGYIELR